MKTQAYKITSNAGADIGTYRATSPLGALNRMARDAGCASFEAACAVTQSSQTDWTDDASTFKNGTIALLVQEVVTHVDADGVCDACEAMPTGVDGRASFCQAHRSVPA